MGARWCGRIAVSEASPILCGGDSVRAVTVLFPAVLLECPKGFCLDPALELEGPLGVLILLFPAQLERGQV